MNEISVDLIKYLVIAMLSVFLINLLVSLILFTFSKIENIKSLCWYWSALLLTYVLQGTIHDDPLSIALAFSTSILPTTIVGKILFDSINKETPIKRYAMMYAAGVIVSTILSIYELSFTIIAMPVCIAVIAPLVEPAFYILIRYRHKTSVLQKFMGFNYILSAIHGINFTIFRMVPNTEIFGFGTALILYFVMSISLFAFAFEEYSKEEKKRLLNLVKERTKDLSNSFDNLQSVLKVKDNLIKVVIHDIASPVQAQLITLEKLQRQPEDLPKMLPRLFTVNDMIISIINQVRSIELLRNGKMNIDLESVSIDQCMKDVLVVFEDKLQNKNIKLKFENNLPSNISFTANSQAFTFNVLNNLISNAIKFSKEGSTLKVKAYERDEKVLVEIEDNGVGMPEVLIQDIFDPMKKTTRLGTSGEQGTGYGLPLAKSFVDYFGGQIDVESRSIDQFPMNHGTKFTVRLEKSAHLQ